MCISFLNKNIIFKNLLKIIKKFKNLCYNINMKKILKKFNFVFLSILILLSAVFCVPKITTDKKVFADEEDDLYITSTTEITNDGTIFTPNLWRALKKFYEDIAKDHEELQGRIRYQDEETKTKPYFYIDLFRDFPNITFDLSGKEIDSVLNLRCMDLSSFSVFDFSNNSIEDIGTDLSNLSNCTELNLSNNKISSFSYGQLHQTCYSQNLTKLDLSQNRLSTCNLYLINQGDIDVSLNYLEKSNVSLPQNIDVVVDLSNNLIEEPDTTNTNVTYGFQGAKTNVSFIRGQKVALYNNDVVTQAEIYRLDYIESSGEGNTDEFEETLIETLEIDESYEFPYGFFRVKLIGEDMTNPHCETIDKFYIAPPSPTVKMYLDGEELPTVQNRFSGKMVIKFFGEENSKIYYSINGEDPVQANEIEITQNGINIVSFWQEVEEGEEIIWPSAINQLYLIYDAPITSSWLIFIGGSALIVALFYMAIRSVPALSKFHIGKNSDDENGRPNLD